MLQETAATSQPCIGRETEGLAGVSVMNMTGKIWLHRGSVWNRQPPATQAGFRPATQACGRHTV